MKIIQFAPSTNTYVTGRTCGSGDILGIVFIEVPEPVESLLAQAKICPAGDPPDCFSGAHFIYDPLKKVLYQLVDVADTAFTWSEDEDSPCYLDPDETPVLAGEDPGVSPDCTTVNVLIAAPFDTVRNNLDCTDNGVLSDAAKVAMKCALAEVLEQAQVVTAGLTTTDIYVFGSDDLVDSAGTDRGSIMGTTLVDILAATCVESDATTQVNSFPVNQVTVGSYATPNATATYNLGKPANGVWEQTIIKLAGTAVNLYAGDTSTKGKKVTVKVPGLGSVIVGTTGSALIDGVATDVLNGTDVSQTYQFDGTDWIRI